MESGTIICNCKQVSYGQIENVVRGESNIKDVVRVFDDVQKQTNCSTGCGGCHDKIMDNTRSRVSAEALVERAQAKERRPQRRRRKRAEVETLLRWGANKALWEAAQSVLRWTAPLFARRAGPAPEASAPEGRYWA